MKCSLRLGSVTSTGAERDVGGDKGVDSIDGCIDMCEVGLGCNAMRYDSIQCVCRVLCTAGTHVLGARFGDSSEF